MFSSLFAAPLVSALDAALSHAPQGEVAVVGDPALARRLGERGWATSLVATEPAHLRRAPAGTALVRPRELPFPDRRLAAVIAAGISTDPDWVEAFAEWRRTVVHGGLLLLVERGAASEVARRVLCGGLTDVAQRTVGRAVLTSALVRHLGDRPVEVAPVE